MGHGSHYHRRPGSMGTMRPMRVFKGKKLPGHMGSLTVTIQNLEIVAVDIANNVIFFTFSPLMFNTSIFSICIPSY